MPLVLPWIVSLGEQHGNSQEKLYAIYAGLRTKP